MTTIYEKLSKTGRIIGKTFVLEVPIFRRIVKTVTLADGKHLLCQDGSVAPIDGQVVAVKEGEDSHLRAIEKRIDLTKLNIPYEIGVTNPGSFDGRRVVVIRATQTAEPWQD